MRYKDLEDMRSAWLKTHWHYQMMRWNEFDFSILSNVIYKKKTGKGRSGTYNDCIMMADTETSKPHDYEELDEFGNPEPHENHVCCWSISIRFFHMNIVTLYGATPSEFCMMLRNVRNHLQGDDMYLYFHNLSYDHQHLRRFLYKEFGVPKKTLITKPHYPVTLRFSNNIVIKDSLILFGCKLEKAAEDYNVEHKKAVGSWEYGKIRDFGWLRGITKEELNYIECDTLAGVECLDAMCQALGKSIYSIPITATGIIREEVRNRAKKNHGHDWFLRQAPDYDLYRKMVRLYHGGYTHANRYFIDILLGDPDGLDQEHFIRGFDFASSYPFCLLSERYPCTKFIKHDTDEDPSFILENCENFAFIFTISFINIKLKDMLEPMPALQTVKCKQTINLQTDNGRVISAGYCTLEMCEQDLITIADMYEWDEANCTDIYAAGKSYLPRWFTDYVFELFEAKCRLKAEDPFDPVKYSLSKSRLNGVYGLTVQAAIRDEIVEVTEAGEYQINAEGDMCFLESGQYRPDFTKDPKKEYKKYLNRKNSVLPYVIGVYCTAYAQRNIFELGRKCVKRYYKKNDPTKLAMPPQWYYTDTDSAYSDDWDYAAIMRYNQKCKEKLQANGYGSVTIGDKEYWLGVAEHKPEEDTYSEFKVLGSKRYAGRHSFDGSLMITVAGVPKKTGVKELQGDLNKFTKDLIFRGEVTGKLAHYYLFNDIHFDEYGNEIGDSIDLKPCDYHLDAVNKWDFIEEEEFWLPINEPDITDLYEL